MQNASHLMYKYNERNSDINKMQTFFYILIIKMFVSVPQKGVLMITTEFGKMEVKPNEICVIQVHNSQWKF